MNNITFTFEGDTTATSTPGTTETTHGTTTRPTSTTEGPGTTTASQTTATPPTTEAGTQPTIITETTALNPETTTTTTHTSASEPDNSPSTETTEGHTTTSGSSSGPLTSDFDHSTPSSGSPAYSGDADSNVEMTSDVNSKGSTSEAHSSKKKDKVTTPAFHYGLFAAIFAIVGLILVVVVGILKEHRFLRFRTRRIMTQTSGGEGKTSREALHSLLGPSKLGFSRLRTYDSDSEAEEFPIFSRV